MFPSALEVIRAEHRALAAMLHSLKMLLAQARHERCAPNFEVLRAMLFYVDEFPEKLHHKKESEKLFPKLRMKNAKCIQILDRLDRDHARGEMAIRAIEHELLAFEFLGEEHRGIFESAVSRYVDDYLEHMSTEETAIFPEALQLLTLEDWAELDRDFSENKDPLTGHDPGEKYGKLVRLILQKAPAPIGLG